MRTPLTAKLAAQLYVMLVAHYYNCGYGLQNSSEFVYSRMYKSRSYGNPTSWEVLKKIYNTFNLSGDRTTTEQVFEDFSRTVTMLIDSNNNKLSSEDSMSDGDLIDFIAAQLHSPFSKNVIGGINLINIRNALLIPQERAKLTATNNKKELWCSICGKNIVQGEMVTYTIGTDGFPCLNCTNCKPPSVQPCVECGCGVPIDKNVSRAIGRYAVRCPTHAKDDDKKKAVSPIAASSSISSAIRPSDVAPSIMPPSENLDRVFADARRRARNEQRNRAVGEPMRIDPDDIGIRYGPILPVDIASDPQLPRHYANIQSSFGNLLYDGSIAPSGNAPIDDIAAMPVNPPDDNEQPG